MTPSPRPRRKPLRRALVVEADPVARRLCAATLEESGFSVATVESGIAAVAMARERPPQLIVMDFQLPDVPGQVAIGWLRSNPKLQSTPILLLTGRDIDGFDLAANQPLASVRKPLSAESIQETIATLLRR